MGQNYGAGKLDRCKKTLLLSIAEDIIATAVTIGLVLFSGRFLLSIFTSDPQVIELGYTRLLLIFSAYTFSMLYEIMSGYLRGFGISLVPAILTTIGVCGTRVFLDIRRFPVVAYLQNHYVCVPDKPVANGGTDIYSTARLSPVTQV